MRISNLQIRYLHPVLAPGNGDYRDYNCDFDFTPEFSEDKTSVVINSKISLGNSFILEQIDSGNMKLGCFVICQDTMYNEFHDLESNDGWIALDAQLLSGKVQIQPVCFSTREFKTKRHKDINTEFPDELQFEANSLTMVGPTTIVRVDPEQLQPFGAIFVLAKGGKDLKLGEIRTNIEEEQIRIEADAETYSRLCALRNQRGTRNQLMSSVYMPALMETLSEMARGGTNLEQYAWYEVIYDKCRELGINPIDGDNSSLTNAQKLLQYPVQLVLENVEV